MATYYWVGGAGTWDASTTTNWATSSGGSGSAGVPTSADDVIFDTASGASGDVATVVTGAVAKNFSYTGARINFSGSGAELGLYGSISATANPPAGLIDIDQIFMRVSIATGITISSITPFKNVGMRNTVSPAAKATVSLATSLFCKEFFSQDVSLTVTASAFPIDCTKFQLFDYGTGVPRTIGTSGSTLSINITPVSAGTAFNCAWADATAELFGVIVTVKNAIGNQNVSSVLQASYATSFSLIVDNSIINTGEILGGVNNLSLINSATFRSSGTVTPVFNEVAVNNGSTITASSTNNYLSIQKKAGSPNTTRGITNFSGGTWVTLGIRNIVTGGTDTILVAGNIGTLANPVGSYNSGAASYTAGTLYASAVVLSNGANFSGIPLNVEDTFSITALAAITGSYTVNTNYASFNTNGVLVPNINISGNNPGNTSYILSNLLVTNLSVTTILGGGGGGVLVRYGSSITVNGTFTLAGASASDIADFRAYDLFGETPLPWNVIKSSGVVSASFARIAYSNASGGANFQAFANNGCINGGNNTGWQFFASSGFFMFI
jgi:hypothetical protein